MGRCLEIEFELVGFASDERRLELGGVVVPGWNVLLHFHDIALLAGRSIGVAHAVPSFLACAAKSVNRHLVLTRQQSLSPDSIDSIRNLRSGRHTLAGNRDQRDGV